MTYLEEQPCSSSAVASWRSRFGPSAPTLGRRSRTPSARAPATATCSTPGQRRCRLLLRQANQSWLLKDAATMQDHQIGVGPQQHRLVASHDRRAREGAARAAVDARGAPLHPVEPLLEAHHVGFQDLLTAFFERHLEVVVADDLDELLSQAIDYHALGDSLDHFEGVHVCPDILEKRSHKFGLAQAVADQDFPQLFIFLRLAKINGLRHVADMLEQERKRLPSVAHARQHEDHFGIELAALAQLKRAFQPAAIEVSTDLAAIQPGAARGSRARSNNPSAMVQLRPKIDLVHEEEGRLGVSSA